MSGKHKRLLQIKGWLLHIAHVDPGSALQVGIHYDPSCGWRVYQSLAGKTLALRPADAFVFADVYDEMREKVGPSPLDATLGRIRALAAEAQLKNKSGERPALAPVL